MRLQGVILETGDRPIHLKSLTERPPVRGFKEKFHAALRRTSATVVRRGDTLSEIVSTHLRATGRAGETRDLYRTVAQVAHANHISDPDLIRPGQVIDLSMLETRESSSQIASTSARTQPWDNIVNGDSRLSSEFGMRVHPIHGRRQIHHGIDVAAKRGTPIQAMEGGTVIHSGWHGGHGKAVVVRHADGVETLYAHASRTLVRVGDRVSADTPLALVGSTGKSTGPHLHFEVRVDGDPVDPLAYLEWRGEA